ncbi:MAG: sigma-70 family RNA polymerase sigma factor [Lachnospiraceae bacterium]|nr:sigma-70 family RNA polymerase sigma factor [Lachnospiraceae bacterium]
MKDKQIKKLVEAMENGDNKAFEKLYNETSRTVYFICLSFLNNEQDAQDVMQEVYITAYNKVSQLQDKDKFVPWLNQIAVNRCKNQLLKNTPMPMDPEDFVQMPVEPGEIFLPEDYIVDKEKRKIIMDIMRSCLSDIQYKTVILFYFNGLTINEIAEIMECPPGTVTYRLSVARGKLKQGILYYEGANDYRLHASAGIPFLASILAAEAVGLQVPNIFPNIMGIISNGVTAGAGYAMSGVSGVAGGMAGAGGATAGAVGTTVVKATAGLALKAKIAIAVAATVIVGGGAAVMINMQNKKEEPSKNIEQYDAVESMSADELRDYFVEEYGFVQLFNYTMDGKDEPMMGHQLTLENENGGFRIDIQYVVEGNRVKYIQIYNFQKKGKDNVEDYIEMCSFLIDNSDEKEQLTKLIKTYVKDEKQIGNEKYKLYPDGDVKYDAFQNGFSEEVDNKSILVITVDW